MDIRFHREATAKVSKSEQNKRLCISDPTFFFTSFHPSSLFYIDVNSVLSVLTLTWYFFKTSWIFIIPA